MVTLRLKDGAIVEGLLHEYSEHEYLFGSATLTFPMGNVQSVNKLLINASDVVLCNSAPMMSRPEWSRQFSAPIGGASLADYLSSHDNILFMLPYNEAGLFGRAIIHAIKLLRLRWNRKIMLFNEHIPSKLMFKLRTMGVEVFNSMDWLLQSNPSILVDAWCLPNVKLQRWLSHQRRPIVSVEQYLLPSVKTLFLFDCMKPDLFWTEPNELIIGFGGVPSQHLEWNETLWHSI